MNENNNELDQLRRKITKLDSDLLSILKERMGICKLIGQIKQKNAMSIFQSKRTLRLKTERKKLTEELDLNPIFVEKLFQIILDESIRIQTKIKGE